MGLSLTRAPQVSTRKGQHAGDRSQELSNPQQATTALSPHLIYKMRLLHVPNTKEHHSAIKGTN